MSYNLCVKAYVSRTWSHLRRRRLARRPSGRPCLPPVNVRRISTSRKTSVSRTWSHLRRRPLARRPSGRPCLPPVNVRRTSTSKKTSVSRTWSHHRRRRLARRPSGRPCLPPVNVRRTSTSKKTSVDGAVTRRDCSLADCWTATRYQRSDTGNRAPGRSLPANDANSI